MQTSPAGLAREASQIEDSMHQRPLGTQLDGVQGALDRAVKRLQSAKDVAEEAKQNIVAEQANIAKLTAEKADIETKIKQSVGGSPASDTAELSAKLQAMYAKMQSQPGIAVETVEAARTQMESLLAGLEAILVCEQEDGEKPDTADASSVHPKSGPGSLSTRNLPWFLESLQRGRSTKTGLVLCIIMNF